MAFNAGSIKAQLDLDTSRFKGRLREARQATSRFSGGLGRLAKFGAIFGGLTAGALAFRRALSGAIGFIKSGVSALGEYQDSVAGLGAALKAQGIQNIEETTAAVEEFAAEFQNATGVSDDAIVSVAQQLTTLGVAGKVNLTQATETVIDFSKAMKIDIKTAARSFGQAIQGNAATLGRYLPAVRELTKEQLANGEAFKLAQESVGGFSRDLGVAGTGPVERMRAAFTDLSKAVAGPFLEAINSIAPRLQAMANVLTGRVKEDGTEAFNGVQAAADSFGTALGLLIDKGLSAASTLAQAWQFVREVFEHINIAVARVGGGLSKVLGIVSEEAERAAGHFASMEDEARRNIDNLRQNAAEIQNMEDRLRKAASEGHQLQEAAEGTKDPMAQVADKAEETEEKAEGAAAAVKTIKQNTDEAAGAAGKLAGQFSSVAAQMQRAAQFRDQPFVGEGPGDSGGGGTGGGGGSIAGGTGGGLGTGGIHHGGSSRLNLSDPFEAVATLQTIRDRGQLPAGAFQFQRNARENLVNAVTNEARALIRKSTSALVNDILRELNSQGVLDPEERTRIVRQRFDEAVRLGTIPDPSRVGLSKSLLF